MGAACDRNACPRRTPGVPPEEVGGDARFIHEDQVPRIVERQRRAPLAAIGRDIRAPLFVGVYALPRKSFVCARSTLATRR